MTFCHGDSRCAGDEKEKVLWKGFSPRRLGTNRVCLRVYVYVCASSLCLSLGMTEFDCEKSIIVSHILLKMPTRQLEDQCCPINIYSTSLATHFVYQQQTESDPNVNEL